MSKNKIKEAIKILKNGGVIIFPTETVYGIGCAYDNQKAIDRIYEIKKRPKDKPLQILISNMEQLELLGAKTPEEARGFWPGPITIIVPTGRDLSLGLRMPDHPIALEIIRGLGKPLAATSANLSGEEAPISFDQIKIKADFAIDGGPCKIKKASEIIDFTKDPPVKLR
ncbi:threonylcarbamoyl-AMP synthase [candidate division WOR-1 bacterium RIFOXYA12_FULL_43_27]|uniref:L-threonylcarbamoyladenylate synthase n=1 Tax=candidate division WOR-1 bacterium RIFOXYC2_FULL_46_14 TaxID=1802587 RepID=A0A1F4U3T7_UNCSA|nr:MAG: threonylcarbamoyl-AMP synthase [candidate division WOR-1 bacterium RIFOXYA12_FULL_43_27]OGC20164.1 MAG: threonylcarbamoyl-AMP synthase [candidate division WOR-1 bacterium RIFOXYB2_FULL_46_45]OGC32099.1 MAG: threonylcarbamoyl-AMP synthase [candidate division WOR-1 bacterium RIFOXYA2_FULL_46_56]OGC39500.1 MAG: threonylcarbamoyl-AMP synthase [candidate division WOR-1 bacterium RIFOXYC2_FULL_46_14]